MRGTFCGGCGQGFESDCGLLERYRGIRHGYDGWRCGSFVGTIGQWLGIGRQFAAKPNDSFASLGFPFASAKFGERSEIPVQRFAGILCDLKMTSEFERNKGIT